MNDVIAIIRDLNITKVDRQTIPSLRLKQQQHCSVTSISAPLLAAAAGTATMSVAFFFTAFVFKKPGTHLKNTSQQQNGKQHVHYSFTLL